MADTDQDAVGISEAASRLGISVEAVRQRIRRKKLLAYKADDGTWRIVLPVPGLVQDNVQAVVAPNNGYTELVNQLRSEVVFLREEMGRQREQYAEESRRKDVIIHELTAQLNALPDAVVEIQHEQPRLVPEESKSVPMRKWWKFWEVR